MSIPLPVVNLASVSVGTTGIISLANIGISSGGVSANPVGTKNAGTLHLYNESGSGLLMQFITSGSAFHLPAGGWVDKTLFPGEQGLLWTVLYNLPNPPVTSLLATYYGPNEPAPRTPTLGNSPIGIGGTVATSSVQTLSNETNSSQTLVIDIGQTGHTLLITINSDGSFVWSVLQSGTAHQVLKAQTSGNPLQVGATGDIAEVLGSLTVDQNEIVTGTFAVTGASTLTGQINANGQMIIPNNQPIQFKNTSAVVKNILALDGNNDTALHYQDSGAGSKAIRFQDQTNANVAHVDNNGLTLDFGAINFLTGAIKRVAGADGTACGSGTTITHGLGATPGILVATPNVAQPGSATVGVGSIGATTFVATIGAGSAIDWLALA